MKETLDDATEAWGVQVERVEVRWWFVNCQPIVIRLKVKDVRVPEQLMRAMAAEAEAARDARAKVILKNNWFRFKFWQFGIKVIAAEGEHKASRALRMAAEVIMDSPAALQVGFLATLVALHFTPVSKRVSER